MDTITLLERSFAIAGSLVELKALQYFHSKGLDVNTDDMRVQKSFDCANYRCYQIRARDIDVEVRSPHDAPLEDFMLDLRDRLKGS